MRVFLLYKAVLYSFAKFTVIFRLIHLKKFMLILFYYFILSIIAVYRIFEITDVACFR